MADSSAAGLQSPRACPCTSARRLQLSRRVCALCCGWALRRGRPRGSRVQTANGGLAAVPGWGDSQLRGHAAANPYQCGGVLLAGGAALACWGCAVHALALPTLSFGRATPDLSMSAEQAGGA